MYLILSALQHRSEEFMFVFINNFSTFQASLVMSYGGVLRRAVTDAAVVLRATHPASSYAFLVLSREPVHTTLLNMLRITEE